MQAALTSKHLLALDTERAGLKSCPGSTAQAAGLLVSRRAHGAHHRAPFEGNYCIVSGAWNGVLDAGGSDQSFFRRLERFVVARGGAEPRCWHEPDYSWQVCIRPNCMVLLFPPGARVHRHRHRASAGHARIYTQQRHRG